MFFSKSLARTKNLTPDKVATRCKGRVRTFVELVDRIQRLAGALQEMGLQKGDKVAMWALNSDRYLEYLLAVPWAGGVIVPVNYRWSEAEVVFSIDDAEVSILLVDDAFCAAAQNAAGKAKTLKQLIYAGDKVAPQGMHPYEELISRTEPVDEAVVDEKDLAGIFYTGGTTGFPKGVMLSHLNLWSSAMTCAVEGWCVPGTTYLHVAPMFHLADLAASNAALITGSSHVFVDVFDPPSVLERIQEDKVTECLLVPTMIQMLIDHPDFKKYNLSTLCQLIYGASPMSEGLLMRTMEALPEVKFMQGYGMTELSPVNCILPPKYHTAEGLKLGKTKSAGRPACVIETKIVDENDNEVPRGTVGQIISRGPGVMMGYWKRPEETAEALKGGWMHTGDGAYMDEDGFVFLVDRIKDMIISGGENVYSAEVENAISTHPAVAQNAVIGIPHEKWGETVHAVIVLKPSDTLTEEEIKEHCHDLIAGYKCPRSVSFVDALPMSGAGKIQKNVLREHLREVKDRGIN